MAFSLPFNFSDDQKCLTHETKSGFHFQILTVVEVSAILSFCWKLPHIQVQFHCNANEKHCLRGNLQRLFLQGRRGCQTEKYSMREWLISGTTRVQCQFFPTKYCL